MVESPSNVGAGNRTIETTMTRIGFPNSGPESRNFQKTLKSYPPLGRLSPERVARQTRPQLRGAHGETHTARTIGISRHRVIARDSTQGPLTPMPSG